MSSLAHVRGLLDAASAKSIPIGGILNMALERRDAIRVDQRLVVTQGCISAGSDSIYRIHHLVRSCISVIQVY